LSEVFGRHAIFGFGIGGFYEHATELLESFGLFKHLGGILYDGGEGTRSIGQPLKFVLGIFVPQCASGSFAEWFGLKMTEIQVEGESAGHIVGLDAPEGGQSGHTVVEACARYHIGTKVRSF
jgi:hypothetical protein